MRRLVLALTLALALGPRLAAQDGSAPELAGADAGVDAGAPARCEIHGRVTIPGVRVVPPHGPIRVVTIDDREVRVRPLRRGSYEVHTHGEGERVEGRTPGPIPFAVAHEQVFGGVARVASGTRIDALEPYGEAYRGTIAVDDGVVLARVPLACADVRAAEPTDAALGSVTTLHGPRWHARVTRLRLRPAPRTDAPSLLVELTPEVRASLVLVERARTEGWARVEVVLAHAHLEGWARDTDLTLPEGR